MCRTKTETLAVVHEFSIFTGTSNGSDSFCTVFLCKFFYRSNVQKVSDPSDLPVKNVNSCTTAKVSVFVLHKVSKQSYHTKTKAWHIIFIIQWIYTRG